MNLSFESRDPRRERWRGRVLRWLGLLSRPLARLLLRWRGRPATTRDELLKLRHES